MSQASASFKHGGQRRARRNDAPSFAMVRGLLRPAGRHSRPPRRRRGRILVAWCCRGSSGSPHSHGRNSRRRATPKQNGDQHQVEHKLHSPTHRRCPCNGVAHEVGFAISRRDLHAGAFR